ncbi:unnamed protein product [Rhizophagus irregularis]|nr:unnamed protein product [Rhizophagus irregularis]
MYQTYKDSQSKKLMDQSEKLMDQFIEWIPYSQFTNVEEIARGGFGIIYCATRDQKSVILKKFKNSQDTSRYFLNELKSNQNCYEIKHHIIRIHAILWQISEGLETIHKADYIHRDFHSGNILYDLSRNLGPEFAKKSHPKAIYTSRPLSFFISKCSSINSSKDYISRELEFDISIESYTSRSLSVPVTSLGKRNIEELNVEETNNDRGKHVKLVHRNIE